MKFNKLEIFINENKEISIVEAEPPFTVSITADQADLVADEIKRLAQQIKNSKGE